jgi:UDP-N-acetylglucosamine 2-epimerase
MNPRSSNDFQNGIIELFKIHKTYDLNIMDCQKKGDVTCEIVIILLIINFFYHRTVKV